MDFVVFGCEFGVFFVALVRVVGAGIRRKIESFVLPPFQVWIIGASIGRKIESFRTLRSKSLVPFGEFGFLRIDA